MLLICFLSSLTNSVGWMRILTALPTAFRRSRASPSLEQRLSGRPLISVSVQEHGACIGVDSEDEDSGLMASGGTPCWAARPPGMTSRISAPPPASVTIPRLCPSASRRRWKTRPKGIRRTINSIWRKRKTTSRDLSLQVYMRFICAKPGPIRRSWSIDWRPMNRTRCNGLHEWFGLLCGIHCKAAASLFVSIRPP